MSLASVLVSDIASLSPDEGALLRLASLGHGVTLGVAAAAAVLDSHQAQLASQRLVAKGFLCGDSANSRLVFNHELVREIVYDAVVGTSAHSLHGAVATALEGLRDPESAEEDRRAEDIVWHRARSVDPSGACEQAVRIAKRYEDSGHPGSAAFYLRLAETTVPGGRACEWGLVRPLYDIAQAFWRLGLASDCARALRRLLMQLKTEADAPHEELRGVLWTLGRALTLSGDALGALEVLGRVDRMARSEGDLLWVARVNCSKAAVHQMRGEFERIDVLADEGIAILETGLDDQLLSQSYNVKGNARYALCFWDEAIQWYEKAAETALRSDEPQLARAALANSGLAWLMLGEWSKSGESLKRARAMVQTETDSYGLEMLHLNEGTLHQRLGALREASSSYREASAAARRCGDEWGLALSLSNMGEIELQVGNAPGALRLLDDAERLMEAVGSVDDLPELLRRKALALATDGHDEEARSCASRAARLASTMRNALEVANCERTTGEILLMKGCSRESVEHLEAGVQLAASLDAPYEHALAMGALGRAKLSLGEVEEALRWLTDSLEQLRQLGARRDAGEIQDLIAEASSDVLETHAHLPGDRDRLNGVFECSRRMSTSSSPREVLQALSDSAAANVPAETVAAVFRLDDGGLSVVPTALLAESVSTDELLPVIRSLMERARADSADSIMCEPESDPACAAGLPESLGIRRSLMVPICSKGTVRGAIYLDYRRRDGRFSKQDLRFLEALAAQAAVALENVVLRAELEDEVEYLRWEVDGRSSFSNIIGRSLEMQKLFILLQKVSRTSVTILIEGESGTGKELVARAIHFNSPRKGQRFLAQNCAALPEQLLESELFGHVRGAFTGAMREKAGLFEAADGGTFFLDEIADMPPSLQVKLLRVLQDGEIRRVGANELTRVDVRIVAATNKNLKEEVEAGRFREDLYYRLNVIRIEMPPLRARRDDIPLLAQHFLDKYAGSLENPPTGFTDDAMDLLANYDWPGNVRELENEIQRAIALAKPGSGVSPNVLSERMRDVEVVTRPIRPGSRLSLKDMVEDVEKRVILQVLSETRWNKSRTAKMLGLSRQGLLKKIARFGIEPPEE